jgi:pyruvate/2-oxoacid:ferredoxin oxidoreductase alpha subunit
MGYCRRHSVEAGKTWAFDAPGADFKLALEAYRIHLAHLFDPMMAVHTSNVEPLPHQISTATPWSSST